MLALWPPPSPNDMYDSCHHRYKSFQIFRHVGRDVRGIPCLGCGILETLVPRSGFYGILFEKLTLILLGLWKTSRKYFSFCHNPFLNINYSTGRVLYPWKNLRSRLYLVRQVSQSHSLQTYQRANFHKHLICNWFLFFSFSEINVG